MGPQVADLQAANWLCDARTLMPPPGQRIIGGEIDRTGDYTDRGIERANKNRPDVMTAGVVKFWQRDYGDRPTIAYAVSVDHARNLANVFNDAGIPAAVILGDTSSEERSKAIAGFRKGILKVLVNVVVATEGFDLPDASCIVIARPTMSLALYLQMVGRGLRPKDGGDCLILDLAANSEIHGLPEAQRKWSLEPHGMQSLGEALVVWCRKCETVTPAASHHCRGCGDAFGKDYNRCREKARKQNLLKDLKERFEQNFLTAYDFYKAHCTAHISFEEYENEKINYVRSWVRDHLDNNPDSEQAAAIGVVESDVQVVARAGSGKTTTLVNRALFLQKHCGVASDKMLLLAFNRKAAEEMRDRLDSDLQGSIPHVMTFHALAYALVHPEKIIFDEPEGEKSQSRAIQDVIDGYRRDSNYYDKIRTLMMAYFRADWDRIILGDRNPAEMLCYRRSLRRESLNGDYVKSFGEKVIANFLFEHDIKYKYERNFWWNDGNYRPDFTIGDKRGIIIEYFGRRGDPDYDVQSEEKRNYWENRPNWRLLEFVSDNLTSNGVKGFYSLLKQKLEACKIPCNRLSEEEIWDRIKDHRAIDRFTRVTTSFIERCRELSLTPEELSERVNSHGCDSHVEQDFLDLAQVFYKSYLERLQAKGEEDFGGLMQKAAEIITEGKTVFRSKSGSGDLKRIRYVLIDEYQDFSELFYRLVQAIREQNPRARFFCVGDDWQAINGFAGSDLRFFQNFEQFFEDSRELPVATNYRSARAIVDVGNALMKGQGTPARAHKKMTGKVTIADLSTFEPTPQEEEENSRDNLTPAVLRLVNKAINDGKNVVLLSRKNSLNSLPWYINYRDQRNPSIERGLDRFLGSLRARLPDQLADKVTISTAHKYKGLQKDVVIVLDAVPQCYPSIHPNLIFTRVFDDSIERVVAEERRLFYVALTRAVEDLFILTEKDNSSPFLEDLERNISRLEWSDYPPLVGTTKCITIRVGNQNGRGAEPTFAVKDWLSNEGYSWNGKTWHSTRLEEGFSVEEFAKQERWSNSSDGIEVRFYDHSGNEKALYHVDGGQWKRIYDKIRKSDD